MIYLDHHATTAPAPEVLQAMLDVMRQTWANPSSPHGPGQQAKRVLAGARGQIAQALGCKPAEVICTSGATEANQLALLGLLAAAPVGRSRLVLSSVEHAGLLKLARALAAQGRAVDFIPVRPDGQLDMAAAAALLAQPDVALLSVQAANNETGVLMPLPALAQLAQAAGVPLHVDATQLIGKLPFHFGSSGAAAVSLSAHKFHGPKGVGALLLRQGTPFATPTPGSQERARRGGTENLPGIVGMATALGLLGDAAAIEAEAARQAALRDHLEAGLRAALPATHVWSAHAPRLPGLSYLRVGLIEADVVLERLGRLGVAAASGSACASGGSAPSHVLTAMGADEAQALATVRLSLGQGSTEAEIEAVIAGLPPLLAPLLTPAGMAGARPP